MLTQRRLVQEIRQDRLPILNELRIADQLRQDRTSKLLAPCQPAAGYARIDDGIDDLRKMEVRTRLFAEPVGDSHRSAARPQQAWWVARGRHAPMVRRALGEASSGRRPRHAF